MGRQRSNGGWLTAVVLTAGLTLVVVGCGGESQDAMPTAENANSVRNSPADFASDDAETGQADEALQAPMEAFSISGMEAEETDAESKTLERSTTSPEPAMSVTDNPARHDGAKREGDSPPVSGDGKPTAAAGAAPSPGSIVEKDSKQDGERGRAETPTPDATNPSPASRARNLSRSSPDQRRRMEGAIRGGAIGGGGFGGGLPELAEAGQRALQLDLQPGEELWIIARSKEVMDAADPASPGTGSLMATLPNTVEQVPVPLKHTAVEGNVDGYIATVDVRQQFHNPYSSKIEAVYVFPLPQNAAVNEFVMTVGDRKIRGIIREREKAEQLYAAARSRGHVAALMTQERPNIFTQKVANIEPGKQIDINIRYFNTLQYDDGAYEFVFPMVVGPRFNPAGSTEGVSAVPRGQAGSQKTNVPYLAPNERSGHDISLTLNVNAGVEIEDINSVNHAVDVRNVCESQRQITLAPGESIPNKDFVLRYRVAGDQIKTAMLTHEDEHGKYFTMMLYPPSDLAHVQRSPMEMVFVIDCSGSMRGKPLAQAKAAISHALQSLTPRDTFQIIRFSNNASQLGAEPVLATDENIQRGLQYLATLNGTGGTQMIEGIRAALDFPHDEGRFRLVSFMTDGYIGNEQQILGTLYDKLGASRIFSFGVGSSPNRYLMDRMAVLGRGAVAYLSLNDNATEIMDRFNQRISHPAMTDLKLDFGDMRVADVYPQRLPDLIVGRPVVVTGRFKGEPGTVKVQGRVDLEPAEFSVAVNKDDAAKEHKGIAAVWARLKIKDMMNYATHAPEAAQEIRESVTETALAYNLMSSYTAFVAVDSLSRTEGEYGTTVAVPVPVPDGVPYDTTVGAGN